MSDFTTTLQKKFWYQSSLSLALARHLYDAENRPWWNLIDHNFYLGALPLSYMGHPQILKDLGITLVISVIENFEISVLTPEWVELGIKNIVIKAMDFHPLDQDTFELVVKTIRDGLVAGEVVYIHCKAGVGRSALGSMAYLLAYGLHDGTKFNSAQEVHDYVAMKRPLVNLSSEQKLCLHKFEDNYRANNDLLDTPSQTTDPIIHKDGSEEPVNLSELSLDMSDPVPESLSATSEEPINLSQLGSENIKSATPKDPLLIIVQEF